MLLCCCAYRALIITTGLDAAAFETLLESFKPVWLSHTPRSDNFNRVTGVTLLKSRRGRPRVLDAAGGLAIVLHWLRSKCSFCDLCFVFGTVPSCTNIWVQFGLICLYVVLPKLDAARVHWPRNSDEVRLFCAAIATRCPHLKDCWGMLDGLNLRTVNSTDEARQNAAYNGWLHGCFVSSLFVFTPDGCIAWYITNAPGSWHDSHMAAQVIAHLCMNFLYELIEFLSY